MKKTKTGTVLRSILLGKRYSELTSISDQVRYMTMNSIFTVAIFPLVILGITMVSTDFTRAVIDFIIAFLCLASLILIRSKIPLKVVPFFPVTVFGAYCVFLVYLGDLGLWASVWLFSFPPIVIFLCQMTIGVIESVTALVISIVFMYTTIAPVSQSNEIRMRFIGAYILILCLTIIYERISILKDRKEAALNAELAHERDIIQTMKDNIHQGIFLMDKDLKILPQYSRPLINILSYYDSELAGKNFLDILAASLDAKQLQTMKGYFAMVFSKSKSIKVLESANPISEFEYKIDDRLKNLSTRFNLIEQSGSEPVIIGIIQDITREKEFEKELQTQKETQELEMKKIFDVIQVDPLVFHDFIDDTEANFNYINEILKDKTLSEKEVITKFFQNVHAIKSNALVLGLEDFGGKLHSLEDDIKKTSAMENIGVYDILTLAIKLEALMQQKDSYIKTIDKIEAFRTANKLDTILIHTLSMAVEKIAAETNKNVGLKTGQIDMDILNSKLRRPIKDILFQCIRNSIFHGIETSEERIAKNKSPQGLLTFTIKHIDGNAEVVFSDDGRGLDWEKIKNRYLMLHPETKDITRKLLLSSIFLPEFSTSEETTSIAGRGVGLSLVKDIVKENNASIKIDSSESGLTFKFTFPLAS